MRHKTMIWLWLMASVALTVICIRAQSQPADNKVFYLRFAPMLNGRELHPDSAGTLANEQNLTITLFRCYISGVFLSYGDKEVWREENSYHLLDAEVPGSLRLKMSVPASLQYNSLHFNLGIDSTTNTSGAHGGDLDPVKGMYWAWQSGYINFKLEGTSSQSTARLHQFRFHLGGYQPPYASVQPIALPIRPAEQMLVAVDIDTFLRGLDFSKQNSIMIPGIEAVLLSQKAATIFELKQP